MQHQQTNQAQTQQPALNIDPTLKLYIDQRLQEIQASLEQGVPSLLKDALAPVHAQLAELGSPRQASTRRNFKVNPPPIFDGSRDKGEAFQKSCALYLFLCKDDFPDVETSIGWTLSYMSSGRAQTWRDEQLEYLAEHHKYRWDTMEAFNEAFTVEFLPVAEAQEALVKLEGRSYHQKPGESVDTYIDSFRDLVKKAKLVDKGPIVVKFRRGLAENIASTLADSPHPPPDNDVDAWYDRARDLERNRLLQRTISGGKQAPVATRPNFFAGMRPRLPENHAPQNSPMRIVSGPPRMPGLSFLQHPSEPPVPRHSPMDVDAARQRSQTRAPLPTDICRRCAQPGHWAQNCPRQYDVHFMTYEELESQIALARDQAELQARHESEAETEQVLEESEDFGTTSG